MRNANKINRTERKKKQTGMQKGQWKESTKTTRAEKVGYKMTSLQKTCRKKTQI